jgi:eukaryotic-like serine/threonine-protein kinase
MAMPETTQIGSEIEEYGSGLAAGRLDVNSVLLARYKVLGVLGGGGQGAVYQARDLNFPDARRLVAIKEMVMNADDSSYLNAFKREANMLAILNHPAIPKIYDFFSQNDRAYLVMEYINGSDLEAIMKKTKSLPMEKILEWAIDICDVLDYLHSQQETIVFRDMKPANLMIDSRGKVRLVDFGIAKKFVGGKKHTMIGTEGYSAPEQYRGNVSPLSDIYALGATLHHVITRQDPRMFAPFTFEERQVTSYLPDAPAGLQAILDHALAYNVADRYQTCAEMRSELEQLLRGPSQLGPALSVSNPSPTTDAIDEEIVDDGGIQPMWVFKTEDEIRSSPVVFKDLVFVGSYDTNIWALKLATGEFVWKYATEGGIASSPEVAPDADLILCGSEDNLFYAIDYKSGATMWTFKTQGRVRGSALVSDNNVFFGSDDGYLYALSNTTGQQRWVFDAGSEIRSRPCILGDRIIIGTDMGEVFGLELNGVRKWRFKAKRAVYSTPVIDLEGICYFGSFDNHLYALDAQSGYSMWRFRTDGPVISSPAITGNFVVVGSTDGNLYSVNAQTGKEKWRFSTATPIVSSPIVHQNTVMFGDSNGVFYAIDAKEGVEKWRFQAGGGITSAAVVAGGNVVLFAALDYSVYALPLAN